MGKLSAETHLFVLKKMPGDGKCLYWSFIFDIMPRLREIFGNVPFTKVLKDAVNDDLRMLVTGYISRHEKLYEQLLVEGVTEYHTINEYCSAIEQVDEWGGDIELCALSRTCDIIIGLVNPIQVKDENCLSPSYYGQDNPLAKDCVYIYFNGIDHYDALCMVNEKDPNEIQTIFDPNNQRVNDRLREFIKRKHPRIKDVELGFQMSTPLQEVHRMDDSNQTEVVVNSVIPNSSLKRKQSEIGNIPISLNNDNQLPIIISKKFYDQTKRAKLAKDADQLSIFRKTISERLNMNKIIQMDIAQSESDIQVDQKSTSDLRIISNDERQKEPGDKLGDRMQDNDKLTYKSQSSV